MQERSDWTLACLVDAGLSGSDVAGTHSTGVALLHAARCLATFGCDLQKKSRIAQERCPEKRAAFVQALAGVAVEKLVFLDECGFALNLHRLYGWAPKAERCCEMVPFNKGKNRSVVGAYSWPGAANPSGLWALWQRLGAWDGAGFEQFVEEALLPQLPAGSVLVMDNARIHHRVTRREKVEAKGGS